jgi:maleylpyruvate isomerase
MIDDDVAGAARAHQLLLQRIAPLDSMGLSDEHIPRPSHLPGWSVGHVLAHLTLHAMSFVRLFTEAEEGRIGRQYPGGSTERAADIERDAGLTAAEHVLRLRESIYRLEGTWTQARAAWNGRAEVASGAVIAVSDLPLRRWREVEVHLGDLGIPELGFDGPDSWSDDYVRRDLRVWTMQWNARGSMGMNSLPTEVTRLEDRGRLAWLLGRRHVPGVIAAGLL